MGAMFKVWSWRERKTVRRKEEMAQNAAPQQEEAGHTVPRSLKGPGFLTRGCYVAPEVPMRRQGNLTAEQLHAETLVLNEHLSDNLSDGQGLTVSCPRLSPS